MKSTVIWQNVAKLAWSGSRTNNNGVVVVKLFKEFPSDSFENLKLDSGSLVKQVFFSLIAAALLLLLIASPAHSENVILSWTPPVTRVDSTPLTNLSGIKIYWGSSTGNYDHSLDVGNRTNATVSGFTAGSTYYFAVKAYDSNGVHSAYSTEVSYTVSSDTDHDGLSNSYENSHGLNPNVADSDGDGVNDGQEVADGTNPRDGGSVAPVLGTTICSEWNGFLGGMWNVFEHTNMSSHPLAVASTIYDIGGSAQSSFGFNIAAGAQFDSLIHDSPSRTANSYGLVCSAHNGVAGELDGRMVYYKPNAAGARKKGDFQFAFAMALTTGKRGSQFVPFNTFQPSLAAMDASHPIANWIQLTNLGGTTGAGQLIFYDQAGNQLGVDAITLQPGARSDFAAHRFGANVVGTVEWRPNANDNLYLMRNVRYLYDNATGVSSFDSAFQLEAVQGSGGEQIVPIDTISRTAVVEIFNTLNQAVTVDVTVAGGAGASFSLDLLAHGSYHYIADPVLGPNGLGYAIIKGRTLGSIGAVAMEYGRRSDLGIAYLFGVPAKESVGTTLRGSYNTYLGQTSWLVLVSPVAQNVNIVAVKSNGQVAGQRAVSVNGVGAVNLNELDGADSYGVVTVQPESPNSMIGWVLRVKAGEYVIPTPLR